MSDAQLKAYEQLCISYRAIDDFRAKLLGFLPLATGTGIFLLAKNPTPDSRAFFGSIGAFGFLTTLGLFAYEIYGIRKCGALIGAGKKIEESLEICRLGQFFSRPQHVGLVAINEPFAAAIIYPAVLAAWAFLALVFYWRHAAVWSAGLVFLTGFVGTLIYDYELRKDAEKRERKSAALGSQCSIT